MSKYNFLSISDAVVADGIMWCYDVYYDALLKFDMKSGEMTLEAILPYNNETIIHSRYIKIEYYQGKIIFVPFHTDKILIYDISLKTFQSIEFNLNVCKKENIYPLFYSSIIYKDYIYFFPHRYTSILRVDLKNLTVKYISGWNKELRNNVGIYFLLSTVSDNIVYLPLFLKDVIMKFDLETEKYEFIKFKNKKINIYDFKYDGDDFWLSNSDKPFIRKWNQEENILKSYIDLPKNLDMGNCWSFLQVNNKYIYVLPMLGNMLIRINKNTGISEKIVDIHISPINKKAENILNFNIYMFKKISDNLAAAYSFYGQEFIFLDLDKDDIYKIKATLKNEEDINKLAMSILSKSEKLYKIIEEDDEISLELYLNSINTKNEDIKSYNENIGLNIWNKISCRIK